ncbi:hypothetical protein [Virgibacillus kimchii]
MERNHYDPANLSDETLQQVRSLEKTLSKEKGEEIILIAYENNMKDMGESIYKG